MIWISYGWLKKFYSFYVAAVASHYRAAACDVTSPWVGILLGDKTMDRLYSNESQKNHFIFANRP